jgi:hypothetical protein
MRFRSAILFVLLFALITVPAHAEKRIALGIGNAETPSPVPMLFYASQPGKRTLDEGEGGGNPFASALVELLSSADLTLERFPAELSELTFRKSHRFQLPDVPTKAEPADWRFQPQPNGETRVALVLIFSDYSHSDGLPSLPGARHDAARVSAALTGAGFQTYTALDPTRAELLDALRQFAARSSVADFAVLYTTGHGFEFGDTDYLIPNDYRGGKSLDEEAYRVTRLASYAHARRASFVFYGGCRNHP